MVSPFCRNGLERGLLFRTDLRPQQVHVIPQLRPAAIARYQMDFADGLQRSVQTAFQVFGQGFFREALTMIISSHPHTLLNNKT